MPIRFNRATVEIIPGLAVVHERRPEKGKKIEPECLFVTRGRPSVGGS
jgi:hypothetical protein